MIVDHLDVRVGIDGQQLLDGVQQDAGGRMRDIADRDPRNDDAARRLHFLEAIFDLAARNLKPPGKLRPLCGGRDPARGALKQAAAQLALSCRAERCSDGSEMPSDRAAASSECFSEIAIRPRSCGRVILLTIASAFDAAASVRSDSAART